LRSGFRVVGVMGIDDLATTGMPWLKSGVTVAPITKAGVGQRLRSRCRVFERDREDLQIQEVPIFEEPVQISPDEVFLQITQAEDMRTIGRPGWRYKPVKRILWKAAVDIKLSVAIQQLALWAAVGRYHHQVRIVLVHGHIRDPLAIGRERGVIDIAVLE